MFLRGKWWGQGLLSRGLGPHVCLGFVEFLFGAVRQGDGVLVVGAVGDLGDLGGEGAFVGGEGERGGVLALPECLHARVVGEAGHFEVPEGEALVAAELAPELEGVVFFADAPVLFEGALAVDEEGEAPGVDEFDGQHFFSRLWWLVTLPFITK